MIKLKYIDDSELLIPERASRSMGSFTGTVNKKGYAGLREKPELRRFFSYANSDERCIVLDIGANYGSYSYITLLNNNIEVLAFEPNPEVVEDFRHILQTNEIPNVTVHDFGLSNATFRADLCFPTSNIGMGKIAKTKRSKNLISNCKFTTLDSLNLDQVDIVKIDVEGHELEVLEGARETFQRCKPKFLQIEVNSGDIQGKVQFISETYFSKYTVLQDGPDFIFTRGRSGLRHDRHGKTNQKI